MVETIIVGFLIFVFLYLPFGSIICPHESNSKVLKVLCIVLWPLYLVGIILMIPVMIVSFAIAPKDQQDKYFSDFIRDNKYK